MNRTRISRPFQVRAQSIQRIVTSNLTCPNSTAISRIEVAWVRNFEAVATVVKNSGNRSPLWIPVYVQSNGEIIGITGDEIIVCRSQPKLYISLDSSSIRRGIVNGQAKGISQGVIKIDSVSFVFFKALKIRCIRMYRCLRY